MKLIDQSIQTFLANVASSSPAPGGGSVAALSGALGIALAKMTMALTMSKKKFQTLDQAIQSSFHEVDQALSVLLEELLVYIDEDTLAFQEIMKGFALPKVSEEDKQKRKSAILEGTMLAIEVPKKVIFAVKTAMIGFDQVFEHLNSNTLSDQGVSVLALAMAMEGAAYNVLINLSGLEDENQKAMLKDEAYLAIKQANLHRTKYFEIVLNGLFQ